MKAVAKPKGRSWLVAFIAAIVASHVGAIPSVAAEHLRECPGGSTVLINVDQGNPWRPPFGLDRVGARPVVHVQISRETVPQQRYELIAFLAGQQVGRYPLAFKPNPSPWVSRGLTPTIRGPSLFFAHVALEAIPSKVVLRVRCGEHWTDLKHEAISWPAIDADARARPDRTINPIDLGTVFPPHDTLLLATGQAAVVDVAAVDHDRDVPSARLRAWLDGGRPVEVGIPLSRGRTTRQELYVSLGAPSDRMTLHVRLMDGERELWKREIPTMVVTHTPKWPSFGAVETDLRYDAPIARFDPRTGNRLDSLDYRTAWDPKFRDVIVFMPNGSRFVFWRGANFAPFWASRYNAGTLYQWAEDCSEGMVKHPDGSKDCIEPMFDTELRYSRVRIIESSASRVHVRWDYRATDVNYTVDGPQAAEDFYFYPDGFGTRVLTAPLAPGGKHQLSEFIIITPSGAHPFEVLPSRLVEALPIEGDKQSMDYPVEPQLDPNGTWGPTFTKHFQRDKKPMLYRVFAHPDDPATAIYFHPSDPAVPWAYPPMYYAGELATPVYWSNHWPLTRGMWTPWNAHGPIDLGPSFTSVAGWFNQNPGMNETWHWEFAPLMGAERVMPDARGQVKPLNVESFAWLIAYTDLSDEVLRKWAESFSTPPAIEVEGARLDLPSYSVERRALRLVAESHSVKIMLRPTLHTVNPVFEIDQAAKELIAVMLDGKTLPSESYTWDGATLWIRADIGANGAKIDLRFGD